MNPFIAQNILLFAGEMFLMSAVIVALGWEWSRLFRHRASLRHLVWLGAFASLLLLPAFALVTPAQFHIVMPVAPALSIAQDMPATVEMAAAPQPAAFHIDVETMAFAVMALWLIGVCAIALRGLVALFGLRALMRHSRAHVFEDLPEGRYQIRLSNEPNGYGPITFGFFRPVILLPFNAMFWPRERLQAVLLHETAHIGRHDSLSQMLSLLVCALYWPNPLVWIGARALRNEAEIAADDAVLASGMRPSSYAGELLQLASEFRSRQPALAGMPLFMAAPSALEARVESVLAATPLRSGVTTMDVLKIGSIAIVATTALTFARPSLAQDAPPSVTAAPLPPPAAPADVATPSAPAAPAEAPIPPVLPTPAMQTDDVRPTIKVREYRSAHGHKRRLIIVNADGHVFTDREIEHMQPVVENAEAAVRAAQPDIERAEAEVRAAQPEIERAQAEIRANEAVIRAMEAEQPRIQAQVRADLARIQPEIDRAIAEARDHNWNIKVREQVDRAMKRVKMRIEMHDREKSTPDDKVMDSN